MEISKELIGKIGIYCIENIINGKKYIGKSINLYYRLHRHKCDLNKNRHKNPILQNSWNKHGENNFINYVVELCDYNNINEKEEFYINSIGDMNCGIIKDSRIEYSTATRNKMSIAKKNFFANGGINSQAKEIEVYNLSGNYINSFSSIKLASKILNISTSSIHRNINGTYKRAGNFQFKHKNSDKVILSFKKRDYSDIKVKVESKSRYTRESKIFNSILECAKYYNVTPAAIRYHINRKSKFKDKFIIGLVKSCELLETPEKDNQQPSIVEIQ